MVLYKVIRNGKYVVVKETENGEQKLLESDKPAVIALYTDKRQYIGAISFGTISVGYRVVNEIIDADNNIIELYVKLV